MRDGEEGKGVCGRDVVGMVQREKRGKGLRGGEPIAGFRR
jgi:hypothetical protein